MNKLNLRVTDLKSLKCLLSPPATKSLAPKDHISATHPRPESLGDILTHHVNSPLVSLYMLPNLSLPNYSMIRLHHPSNSGFS